MGYYTVDCWVLGWLFDLFGVGFLFWGGLVVVFRLFGLVCWFIGCLVRGWFCGYCFTGRFDCVVMVVVCCLL